MSDTATIASPKTSLQMTPREIPTITATATLLIKCRDQAGIVQAVSEFIHRYGGNIITLDQYNRPRRRSIFYAFRVRFSRIERDYR